MILITFLIKASWYDFLGYAFVLYLFIIESIKYDFFIKFGIWSKSSLFLCVSLLKYI